MAKTKSELSDEEKEAVKTLERGIFKVTEEPLIKQTPFNKGPRTGLKPRAPVDERGFVALRTPPPRIMGEEEVKQIQIDTEYSPREAARINTEKKKLVKDRLEAAPLVAAVVELSSVLSHLLAELRTAQRQQDAFESLLQKLLASIPNRSAQMPGFVDTLGKAVTEFAELVPVVAERLRVYDGAEAPYRLATRGRRVAPVLFHMRDTTNPELPVEVFDDWIVLSTRTGLSVNSLKTRVSAARNENYSFLFVMKVNGHPHRYMIQRVL